MKRKEKRNGKDKKKKEKQKKKKEKKTKKGKNLIKHPRILNENNENESNPKKQEIN